MKAELIDWDGMSVGGFCIKYEEGGPPIVSFVPVAMRWENLAQSSFYVEAEEATRRVTEAINFTSLAFDEDRIAASGIKAGVQYRHFKGAVCVVLGFARHSEDPKQILVLYRKVKGPPDIWARPLDMWFERVPSGGTRFTEITRDKRSALPWIIKE